VFLHPQGNRLGGCTAAAAPHLGEAWLYPGTCRALKMDDRQRAMERGQPYVLRLDARKASGQIEALSFTELGSGPNGERGVIHAEPALLGDIVLARKDTAVAYHLAVVVDDAFQGVSLVTRGNDLFGATHVQRLLQALLGLPAPLYAHHRLVLDARGKKFSKRDHSVTLRSLRECGATPGEIRARIMSP
jgi:glutamyl-Q tRNA(Asp) synthetase